MYDFYCIMMKNRYEQCYQLLYTDTDSLFLEIQTKYVSKDIDKRRDLYDASNYPQRAILHSPANNRLLSKMKDECAGRLISEYMGIHSKMYSVLEEAKNIKKAKGVKRIL